MELEDRAVPVRVCAVSGGDVRDHGAVPAVERRGRVQHAPADVGYHRRRADVLLL